MALTNKLSIDELLALRRMGHDEALRFLGSYHLTPEENAQAMKLVIPKNVDARGDNRLWICTAFLLGATCRQIGDDKGVSRQSVFDLVTRNIPNRDQKRLATTLGNEALSEYKIAFFESIDFLRSKTPEEAAVWLAASVNVDR